MVSQELVKELLRSASGITATRYQYDAFRVLQQFAPHETTGDLLIAAGSLQIPIYSIGALAELVGRFKGPEQIPIIMEICDQVQVLQAYGGFAVQYFLLPAMASQNIDSFST